MNPRGVYLSSMMHYRKTQMATRRMQFLQPSSLSTSYSCAKSEANVNDNTNDGYQSRWHDCGNNKRRVKKGGQSVSGSKGTLAQLLKDVIKSGLEVSEDEVVQQDSCMNNLDVTAYWMLLTPNPVSIP